MTTATKSAMSPGRRRFLADVGRGMLVASVGANLVMEMGLASRAALGAATEAGRAPGPGAGAALGFGAMEPLVALMQETPPEKLMPILVQKLADGTDLKTIIAAAALANARTFGGQDYIGFHTFMALPPAYAMSQQLPTTSQALPVLKVIYRNASRMQAVGGAAKQTLEPVELMEGVDLDHGGEAMQAASRSGDFTLAERTFAALAQGPAGEAFNHLQWAVQDETDVHRVVLAWRAWATLDITGQEHAHAMLRQSVRYCVMREAQIKDRKHPTSPIRALLPRLIEQHKLLDAPAGERTADDAWVAQMSRLICNSSREQAAEAVAAAIAEGFTAADLGEALSLASNELVLRDRGRPQDWASDDKPVGSVHGDSVGVHASDAANAWRNIGAVSNRRNAVASLIVGAFHTAGQHTRLNPDFYPTAEQREKITATGPEELLTQLEEAIKEKDQFRACAIVDRYGQHNHAARPVFDLLLKYGISEDGALHAEKYYATVAEEFARTRPAYRWRQLVALARVTTSEYGKPAPGYEQARELLKV